MIDFKLWDHQKETLLKAVQVKEFALLHDCGTGKTLTTIQILRSVYKKNGRILPTLIVCPVIIIHNWKEEWEKFSNVPSDRILTLTGPCKKRVLQLKNANENFGPNFIAITNYESLVASPDFFFSILDWRPRCLVIDESQRIKSHTSKRTKCVTRIADEAQYKYLLTGTPILNSPMDIFSQYRALDNGKTFGKNFFSFRAKYFYDKNKYMPSHIHFPDWRINPESFQEINELIYSKATRAVKEECLDLPPLVKQRIYVELSPKVAKAYKSMLDHFVAVLEDSVVTADIALVKTIRLLQLVNGFLKDEDGKITEIDSPKKLALQELLQDITPHSKVIVWAAFKQNYTQIREVCEKLKIKYVEAHGGISNTLKYDAVYAFNNCPDTKVFIGHPGSLGIGINLVPASYSIYFSRTFNLEHDLQSEARNYRGGSEIHKKVTRIDLVTKGTIDELVLQALDNKIESAEKILQIIVDSAVEVR